MILTGPHERLNSCVPLAGCSMRRLNDGYSGPTRWAKILDINTHLTIPAHSKLP